MQDMNILHVARNPLTGVWSVMKNLAGWQKANGVGEVGLLVLADRNWPESYRAELLELARKGYWTASVGTYSSFGTLAFGLHIGDLGGRTTDLNHAILEFSNQRGRASKTIVHYHNAWLSGVFMPKRETRENHLRFVTTFHGIQGARALREQPVRKLIHKGFAARTAKRSDALVSVDSKNPEVAKEVLGLQPKAFAVIHNGANQSLESGCPRLNGAAEFVVGHVGGISDGKGWRFTAEAIDLLKSQGANVRLVIAGAGQEAEEARRWCDQREHCEYLGFVRDAAKTVMPRLDLMVLPSLSEGLPMALLEALSAAVPIAATPVGGIPDIIDDCGNGFLIERDPIKLAEIIAQIEADPALHRRLSDGARTKFFDHFSIDASAGAYESLYQKCFAEDAL